MNYQKQLETIRDRYFRPVIAHPDGHLNHHGDCETHRAMDVYNYAPCTCGLLHDLKPLPGHLVQKLFPAFHEHLARQDAMVPGSFYWLPDDEKTVKQREVERLLVGHFGEAAVRRQPEPPDITGEDWSIIEKVFGKPFRDRMEAAWTQRKDQE